MSGVSESAVREDLPPIWPEKVVGGKYVKLLQKHVDRLRDEEPHGNRKLFLDDVFVVSLLAFFNPTIRSLRALEDFSQTKQAQRHLSIRKLCRSTLSDFHQLVDPVRLEPILQSLRSQLQRQQASGPKTSGGLAEWLPQAVAVDGTFLNAAANVTWAIRCANQRRSAASRVRLDCHLAISSWLPEVIVLPGTEVSESESAATHLQDGRLYLYDRGFSGFALLNAHYRETAGEPESRADFVARYRPAGGNSPELSAANDRPLTAADRAAGVTADREGRIRSSQERRHRLLDVPLREVLLSRLDRDGKPQTIRLITNLLDVPAEVIAQLYQHRWQIELFFRWLKCYGHFDHLVSHNRQAVQAQFYVTVIGILLMYLHTGHRPSKYLFVLMSQVAGGGATLEEILPILQERERQSSLARESARRRAQKKRTDS